MPTPSTIETYRTEGCFVFTRHAIERMATRGIRSDAIFAALTYGRVIRIRGAYTYALGRKEISRYAREGIDLSGFDGVQVVVTSDGSILTVYRNRSFGQLRASNCCRRSPTSAAA